MYFDLNKAPMRNAVVFWRLFPAGIVRFWKAVFFSVGCISLTLVGAVRLLDFIKITAVIDQEFFIGLALICLPWGFSVWFFEIFGEYHLKYPALTDKENLAEHLNFGAANLMANASEISQNAGEQTLSTDSILLAALREPALGGLFLRIGFNGKELSRKMEAQFAHGGGNVIRSLLRTLSPFPLKLSDPAVEVLTDARKILGEHGGERMTAMDILAALFDQNEPFRQMMLDIGLDREDLSELGHWYEQTELFRFRKKRFWDLQNLLRKPPIGKDWIYGYSWYMRYYARNLTDVFAQRVGPMRLTDRKGTMDEIEQILARAGENNVLLVGEEGVGKVRIIEDFAERIAHGTALPALNYKQVYQLNLPLLAASSKEPTEVQSALTRLLNEAVKAGNVILIIEDLHNFIGEVEGMGRIDITEILVPYLRSSRFQVIATTNPVSYHKFIESRAELTDVFEKITVTEPDIRRTMRILEESVPRIEYQSHVMVTYAALKGIVESGDKFVRTAPFPEKAFDLLSEVISYVLTESRSVVMAQDVNVVISRKTGVPLGPIAGGEKEKLMNLEELMRKELIGQERAIEVVAATMRRLRAGLAKRGKPAGVFLFVGPTGVGKTQTAKLLSKVYFGSEKKMLRFDMSEYQDIESLDRFLGNLRMQEPGQFVTIARDNPFALILLDELEKANKNILNIFLQVFDEGHLTDVFGRGVSFEQHIIIATSNAGADTIRQLVKEGVDPSMEKERVTDILIQSKAFTPEFLNRFDEIVIFHPLTEDQVHQIARLGLQGLAERLLEQNFIFKPTDDIVDYVAKAGFDPQFGARPIQRVIKDKVESIIAKKVLEGEIRKGKEFSISAGEINS